MRIAADHTDVIHEETSANLAMRLVKGRRRAVRTFLRYASRYRRNLRKIWGEALDQFLAIAIAAEEAGSMFNEEHLETVAADNDILFETLAGLHARACRTAFEVHYLLSGGFPMGALARCRTLHELTVTMSLLQKFGRKPQHLDLAERFRLHDVVVNYRDALAYQETCEKTGYDPYSDEEMAEMRADRDALIDRFGQEFKSDNGWATIITGKTRPTFLDMEELAGFAHLRGFYKWGSHEVHAGSKGWRLNTSKHGEDLLVHSGYMNTGLADPGHLALISLLNCCIYFLFCLDAPEPQEIAIVVALQHLIDAAGDEFLRAHEMLEGPVKPIAEQ